MLNLVTYPDKRLHQASEKVVDFGDFLKDFAVQMNATMIANGGSGLAAVQVGKNIRLFIAVDHKNKDQYIVYINPTITYFSNKKTAIEEGCLSIPGVHGFVERAAKIRLNYQDINGQKQVMKAKGLNAIIIQHEMDHIDGRLIIDRNFQITEGQELLEKWRYEQQK